ncbi:MAG TPA: hypothetical protein VFP15_06570, partial [Gemmatimonadaceae bacterium]|nr:hypothetical protein [Gemmatimonadaceae bacterium]
MSRPVVRLLLSGLLVAAACKPTDEPPAPAVSPVAVPAEALSAIDSGTLMSYVRVLASDSLLGRAPGTVGEDRTISYLVGQFETLGLKPGNTDGTYIQKVPLVGITVTNSPTLTFAKG